MAEVALASLIDPEYLPLAPRDTLERLAEAAVESCAFDVVTQIIAALDAEDGDPDEEIDDWGEGEEARDAGFVYGIDQRNCWWRDTGSVIFGSEGLPDLSHARATGIVE